MKKFRDLTEPYLIAEIGINHNSDIQIAKKLIDATFACGWDCAKFQKRTPELRVPDHQKNVIRKTPWGEMTYLDYKLKIEFEKEEYDLIDLYCKQKPLDWTASVWDLKSLDFICEYDVPFLKIPSALITEKELVEEVARTKIPIIISTGMSTEDEVDNAVNVITKHNNDLVVMHCNSSYPSKIDELNLNSIPRMINKYSKDGIVIGYSGHEYGLDSTTIAASLGAMVIERHVTIDHGMWGTDQSSSIEITGMDKLYKQVRNVKSMMGDGVKKIYDSEKEIRKKLRGY